MSTVPVLLFLGNAALLIAMLLVYRSLKATQKRREAALEGVRREAVSVLERQTRERWEAIDLAPLHELNRVEVERLLGKIGEEGVGAITESEAAFLDRLVDAEERAGSRTAEGADRA